MPTNNEHFDAHVPAVASGADSASATSPHGRRDGVRKSMVALVALCGFAMGIALFTFDYAEGLSYMSNDPQACINCHVMQAQYDGWLHASHHSNATCNDCHVPHDSLAHKYYVKAEHGYRHSKGFTFNDFHEPIQIKASSRAVVAENCLRCHETIAEDTFVHAASRTTSTDGVAHDVIEAADCLHCHVRVGHGPKR